MTVVNFEYLLDYKGYELTITVEASSIIITDIYGQDADGNRGIALNECADVDITAWDKQGNNITKKLIKKDLMGPIIEEAESQILAEDF